MTTISVRVEESLKDDAEEIANTLGLSLSAVINVFLKRFATEKGFPFMLKIPAQEAKMDFFSMTSDEITKLVKSRIAETSQPTETPPVTYIEPVSGSRITHK